MKSNNSSDDRMDIKTGWVINSVFRQYVKNNINLWTTCKNIFDAILKPLAETQMADQ